MAHSLLHELLAPAPAPGGPRGGGARSYKITKEQVRLLLFKESDWRGRKLLFDSSTVEKVPIDKNVKNYTKLPTGSHAPCIVEVADGFAYQYKGPAPDAAILAEMMFGAVAMNYKGISLKIHILNEPQRLMCTKVFGVPIMPKMSCKERKSSPQMSGHSLRSAQSGSDVHKLSKPVDMPDFQLEEGVALSFSFDRGDSGFYSEHSPNSSVSSARDYCTMFESWGQENVHDDLYSFQTPPSGRKLSTTSNGSWQRRMFQNMSTRLDLNYQSSNLLTVPSVSSNPTSFDSHFYSNSTGSGTCDSLSSGSSASSSAQRKTKLGLALLITLTDSVEMEMFRYCVEHSPQLEALISRLRMAVMLSGIQRQDGPRFIATLVQATADALQWLIDLLNGPRLPPVWLNLVTAQHRAHHRIAESLLSDICTVLDHGDTKHTNFFISTLITHVLTYHLGWVTTVSPYDVSHELPTTAIYERSSYNALWAQLSDLCGSIGCPARAARTIVAGKNNKVFLNKVLTVLTYFIRCGDVRRNIYEYQNLADTLLSEINVTSVPITEIVKDSTCATKLEMKRTSTSGKLVNLAESSEILDNVAGEFYKSTVCSDIECKGSVNNNNYTSLKHSATTDMLPQVFAVDSLISRDSISSVVAKNERNISMTLDELKDEPIISCLKRAPTVMHSLISSDSTELYEGTDEIVRESKSVVFVLGDDDKLVGLKNKSCGGKSVKRSSKTMQYDTACANEMTITNEDKKREEITQLVQKSQSSENKFELSCDSDTKSDRSSVSPSRCCGQQSQHSKPIKHSGFKFEFDKYPQIVTNYMKSKNLEILDRHYIGKPGNLKLDNFQFDPTIVPPIQEERCENCYQCQLIESTLQTPTNASEFWSETNEDQAREGRPMLQYAHEEIVTEENCETIANLTPKTFMRKRKKNTVVINLPDPITLGVGLTDGTHGNIKERQSCSNAVSMEPPTKHLRVVNIEIPRDFAPNLNRKESLTGFHYSLLGGLTDHYVPDMILQGTVAAPSEWESDVRRDLDLMSHNNKSYENPLQAIAIVADSDQWEVRVLGNNGVAATGCGMSALVGTMLDALPHMRRAKVPAHECLSFVESKLREFCVLSKTLAEMLMSTDFCDMSTLTRSLNIDVNDVPLLLAVATTHTPQVAARYGISYR